MAQFPSNIVSAFGLTHTPGLGNLTDKPSAEQMSRIHAGFGIVKRQIAEAKPDVMIAFIDDHFDMFTLRNMPAFAIGIGDTHYGPTPETEGWLQAKRGPIPGHPEVAQVLYESLMEQGVELFRFEQAEVVHNVLIPKRYLWPDLDIPVVPIFINCFCAPLPTWKRAHALGLAVGKALAGRPERVALMASGGISHWPPISISDIPADDPLVPRLKRFYMLGRETWAEDPSLPLAFLQREQELAASNPNLINIEWDRMMLDRLAAGDVDYLTTLRHPDVWKVAGSGGSEMLMWVALMGAMGNAPGEVVFYEAVREWMGGVGVISYDKALHAAR